MARILIADDHPPSLDQLSQVLTHLGHQVIPARDGLEALKKAQVEKPDLIISDLLMPNMDGYQLVRRLRSQRALCQIPVIFNTAAYRESEAQVLAKVCGVSRILPKPGDPQTIASAVSEVLGRLPQQDPSGPPMSQDDLSTLSEVLRERAIEREDRNARLEALIQIGMDLGAEHSPAVLLQKFCRSTREVLAARHAALGIIEPGGRRIRYQIDAADFVYHDVEAVAIPPEGMLSGILAKGQPVRLSGPLAIEGTGLPDSFRRADAFLSVPVATVKNLHGLLCLGSKIGAGEFSREDERLATTLAAQIAVAYENAVYFDALQERTDRLGKEVMAHQLARQALHERAAISAMESEVAKALVHNASLGELLQHCATTMIEHLDAALARIWTFNESERVLELKASAGPYAHAEEPPARVPLGQLQIGLIAEERKAHFTTFIPVSSGVPEEAWARKNGLLSFAGYPLVIDDRLVGAMAIFGRKPLSDWTGDALASIANGIASCIDRKRAEEELVEAKEKAESASRLKTSFLANISHEIRTPLTAILGYLDLVRDKLTIDLEGLEYVCIIERSGTHLLQLINDLLDLSQIEAGTLKTAFAPCSPMEILRDAIRTVAVQAQNKGLNLTQSCPPPIPEMVLSDRTRIQQALLNLIGNAIKFTEKGSVHVSLRASARESGKVLLEFEVADTGIGIPEGKRSALFETFHQGDASSTRHYGGAGLGLSISHRIAKLLGGDIRVESRLEVGSRFTLSIPCGVPSGGNNPAGVGQTEGAAEPVKAADPQVRPPRVLVVEDLPENQGLLRLYLRGSGFAVEVAENGAQALESCARNRYDLIIMDLQMPVMNGYEAISELRRRRISVPVIALTAHAMKEDRDRCLAAGFNAYLAKPFRKEELIRLIRELSPAHSTESVTGSTRHAEES
jgi:signal transduction histidine kinase/DNA-binding response OmpR family regulator